LQAAVSHETCRSVTAELHLVFVKTQHMQILKKKKKINKSMTTSGFEPIYLNSEEHWNRASTYSAVSEYG
jgi:hypothetical protein